MTKTFTAEKIRLNLVDLISLPADPSIGAGFAAPLGTLYLRSGTAGAFLKFGALDTDWTPLGGGSSDLSGVDDPSAGAGIAAPISTIYRNTANGYLWVKQGAPDWDWWLFSTPSIQDSPGSSVRIGTLGVPVAFFTHGPNTFSDRLTIDHILSLTGTSLNLAAGVNTTLALPIKRSVLYLNPNAGAAILDGIDNAGYGAEGLLFIRNVSAANSITLKNMGPGVVGTTFLLIGGVDKVIPPLGGAILVNSGGAWQVFGYATT